MDECLKCNYTALYIQLNFHWK